MAPYDIALLKLHAPLQLNENVKIISLPKQNSLPTSPLKLSGWGSTSLSYQPIYPDILQKISLTVVDLNTCKLKLNQVVGPSSPLSDTNLCTGPVTGGISACSGDSGGPLIKDYNNGTKEIVGIVSWGVIINFLFDPLQVGAYNCIDFVIYLVEMHQIRNKSNDNLQDNNHMINT